MRSRGLTTAEHGSLSASVYTGEVDDYAKDADTKREDQSRPGRRGSLYASPTLHGVTRWARAHLDGLSGHREDVETYELTVDGDNTYVYDIAKWEDYSWHGKPAEDYWATGITVTEYLATQDEHDDTNWEVLIRPEDVINSRRVSAQRLISHADDADEMKFLLKRNRIR